MAEETQQQQDGSKTLVSFVVGLLIGGMLVWAFSSPSENAPTSTPNDDQASEQTNVEGDENETATTDNADTRSEEEVPTAQTLPVGNGSITVNNQPAGFAVELDRATYPIEEGWIGVRDYNDGQLSFIKGVVRFSAAGGIVPETIVLQNPTIAGQDYAVVVFSDNGDNEFNSAGDVQIDEIFATFTAQ